MVKIGMSMASPMAPVENPTLNPLTPCDVLDALDFDRVNHPRTT